MKKLLFLVVLVWPMIAFSQSQSKGTLSFNAGFDGGIHGTVSEYYYNNTLVDQDTSPAGTKMFRFDAQYNIIKWVSLGFNYRKGSYIEDPDNAEANGNTVSMFDLGLRFYPVNKEKFALYMGVNFGAANLEINRIYTFFVSTKHRYVWKSPQFGMDLGFNWYFTKNVGMNFALGYSSHNFDLKEYYIDGDQQDLSNQKHTFLTKGVHVNIGVAFRLLGED